MTTESKATENEERNYVARIGEINEPKNKTVNRGKEKFNILTL